MGKFKKTILNSITSLITVFVNSIFSLILGRLIIQHLGSDYNGVNATATQILTVLTLIEGGFTTASIVSLFDPFINNDVNLMNKILSTSAQIFRKISILTIVIGLFLSFGYTFIIKSSIDEFIIFFVFMLSILSTGFNLYFVNTYRIMYQVSQKEYLLNIVILIVNILMQIVSIFIIVKTEDILLVRFVYFVFSIIQGIAIILLSKKNYPFIKLNKYCEAGLIKGTRDVMVSRFTSVIYSSATILFLSSFVGTTATSIYAIYNNVINIVKNCLYSVVNAPQNALGQLLASKDTKKISEVFNEYEYIVLISTLVLMSITYIMIMPFVKIYTSNITDVNYINLYLPVLIISIASLELIHIPSGILILMSGRFKVSRNIQSVTCILLIIFNLIGVGLQGLNGLLMGTLFVNIILASLEIIYSRRFILLDNLSRYVKVYMPFTSLMLIGTFLISTYTWNTEYDIISFIVLGIIVTISICGFALFTSFFINRKDTISILKRIRIIR